MAINLNKYNKEFDVNVTFTLNVRDLFLLVKDTFKGNAVVMRLFNSAVKNNDTETLFKVYLELLNDKLIVAKLLESEDIEIQPVEEDIVRDESGQAYLNNYGDTVSIKTATTILESIPAVGLAKINGMWVPVLHKRRSRDTKDAFMIKDLNNHKVIVYASEYIELQDANPPQISDAYIYYMNFDEEIEEVETIPTDDVTEDEINHYCSGDEE